MICVMTGCHVFSEEYVRYFVGDLFEVNGTYVLKCLPGSRSSRPLRSLLHMKAQVITHWDCGERIVVFIEKYSIFNLFGVPLKEAFADQAIPTI